MFYAVSHTPEAATPGNEEFVAKYKEMFGGTEVPEDAADAFATAQVMQAAVEAVGSVAREDQNKLADWLRENEVETILGPLSWDEAGRPEGEFLIGQWQNGKPEIVLPEDAATTRQDRRAVRRLTAAEGRRAPRHAAETAMTELVQTLILGLLIGGVYALLASGLTLIFGVMNVINVAHGAFLILAAFVTWTLWDCDRARPARSRSLVTTPLMFGFGWLLYNATIRPIRKAPPSASVLLTFSLALVLEGVMGLVWGNTSHAVRTPYFDESFAIGEIFLPKAQVYGCLLGDRRARRRCGSFLTQTWTGRAIRASAVNPQGAELVGVNVAAVAAHDVRGRRGGHRRGRLDRQRAVSVPAGLALRLDLAPARDHRARRAWAACRARSSARC